MMANKYMIICIDLHDVVDVDVFDLLCYIISFCFGSFRILHLHSNDKIDWNQLCSTNFTNLMEMKGNWKLKFLTMAWHDGSRCDKRLMHQILNRQDTLFSHTRTRIGNPVRFGEIKIYIINAKVPNAAAQLIVVCNSVAICTSICINERLTFQISNENDEKSCLQVKVQTKGCF